MQKWEYLRVVVIYDDQIKKWLVVDINGKPIERDEPELNQFLYEKGEEGWEMVSEIYEKDLSNVSYKWRFTEKGWEAKGDGGKKLAFNDWWISYLADGWKLNFVVAPETYSGTPIAGPTFVFKMEIPTYIYRITFKRMKG